MTRSLKTILAATAAVVAVAGITAVGAVAAGPGWGGHGMGFGGPGGGCWATQAQGSGPGMMGGGPGMMGKGGPGMQQRMAEIDTDKDGAISEAEMTAFHDARFAALDTDKDGAISEAEFTSAAPQGFGYGARNPDAMPQGMQDMMKERRTFMFRGFDADNSGAIERSEFAAHHEPRFDMMDANGDGKVTADEMGPRGRGWQQQQPGQPDAPAQ